MTRLREPLFELAASGRPLVVDLDQVSFIDLAGLAALVGTAKRARRARRQPARGLRPAADPPAVPADRTGPPGTAGPHHGRGPGSPGGGPDHNPASRPLRARTAAPGPGGRDRKAMRSGEEASPPGPQAAPAHRVGHAMGSCGLLAMVPESVTVKHHASRAGHGPGAGGHKGSPAAAGAVDPRQQRPLAHHAHQRRESNVGDTPRSCCGWRAVTPPARPRGTAWIDVVASTADNTRAPPRAGVRRGHGDPGPGPHRR